MAASAQKSTSQSEKSAPTSGGKESDGKEPRPVAELSKEETLTCYREMLSIRRFEEKAGQMYGMGLIGGFCHLYIGQEAVVIGMQHALKDGDQVITGYRDHGHMLATGMEMKGVMAELTGRQHGYSRGKGGSMHMFSREKAFYGGHGIVGAMVPLGTGLAFANRYRGNDHVCVTYFGDGAANQGQVYESFNMAQLWKLPVIYVIENNRYAMGTSINRSSATTNLSHRGASFDIPGEQVDGMDVRAVKAAGEKRREMVPRGQWSLHPGNADLPLSRPLDVRSGKIPDPRRGGKSSQRTRPDRAGPPSHSRKEMGERGRDEEGRRVGARDGQ